MLWRIVSYNGFNLKSSTYMVILKTGDNPSILPTVTPSIITTGGVKPPVISGVKREMDTLVATAIISGPGKDAAYRSLISQLDNESNTLHTLVIEDDINGVQWSMEVRPNNVFRQKGWSFKILFDAPDRIWRKANTAIAWNVSSSPATQVVTNGGNKASRPTIKFKPTSVKADGFLYRHWVPIINPNTDRAFSFWGLDLTNGGLDTRPWVKDLSNYVQINNGAGITDNQTTIPYDTLTGSMPTYGMGWIDDGVNVEQICWTGRTGTTSGNLTGVTRAIGGTTAHAFADNTKIYLSYMQANGNDIRFYKNGLEQNIWITGPNTATTKIYHTASAPAGITLELGTAILLAGSVTEIDLKPTVANRTALSALPTSGVILIDNEAFHFTDRDPIRFTFDIDARSINDTDAAAHSVGAVIYFIPNDCWLYSGNPFLDAQDTNDTRKPILTLSTSDNVTRDYTEFWSNGGLRANSWKPKVEQTSYPQDEASKYYTGNHTDDTANPATEMGALMQSIYKNGQWRFESGKIVWSIYEPAGVYRVVTWIYEKYRTGSTWPQYVRLEKSKDGILWTSVVVVTSPSSAGSWGSPVTVGPYLMGDGYYHLRIVFYGVQGAGQSGGSGLLSALETNALQYETVNPLSVVIKDRHDSSYEFNLQLKNTGNNLYFKLQGTTKLNEEIEVDCEAKTVTTLSDNKQHRSWLHVPNTQADWMKFDSGDNPLQYKEAYVTGVTVTIEHDDLLVV